MPCCSPYGYVAPAKLAVLDLLRRTGVELPPDAQVWGPRGGLSWRVVDRYGQDPADGPLGSPHRLRDLLEATEADVVIVEAESGRHLRLRSTLTSGGTP